MMRRAAWVLVTLACAALPAAAQDVSAIAPVPILTLDQDALFSRSLYGQALRARIAEELAKVEAESRRIDSELGAEEQALTQKRREMTPEDFAPFAAAFDQKVQRLRAENQAATAAIRKKEQEGEQEFTAVASDAIRNYMEERGAVAIIDKSAMIVWLSALDVTDALIARIDAALGDGNGAP